MISENSIKGPMPATTSFMLTVHFIFNNLPPPFFFYLSLLSRTFTIHRTAGNGEGISLTPLYHFHPLHRHLDISWATTAESSPLHIASSRTMCRGELSAVIARLIFSFQMLLQMRLGFIQALTDFRLPEYKTQSLNQKIKK